MKAISAVYYDGAFHPLTPIELPEQTSVEVLLPVMASEKSELASLQNTAGAWADLPGVDEAINQMEVLRRSASDRDNTL